MALMSVCSLAPGHELVSSTSAWCMLVVAEALSNLVKPLVVTGSCGPNQWAVKPSRQACCPSRSWRLMVDQSAESYGPAAGRSKVCAPLKVEKSYHIM